MNFGRTLKKALKRNYLPADFVLWSTIARERPRWRLLTHSTPTPIPPPCLRSHDLARAPRLSAIRRNARRRPRRPLRCPRQPRQRPTSAAPSCARHHARQLKKELLKTFSNVPCRFVLGCKRFLAMVYCSEQYFYLAARSVFENKCINK